MADLKKTAKQLAAKGRYGDTMLLHVSPEEVAGLASLLPSGKLPVNPHTGLPEAFFFLPFLASLFGAAAPAAAAATAAAPAAGAALAQGAATAAGAAGALGAGAGAGAGLTGLLGSIGSGVGSLAKGIGSLFGMGGAGAAGAAGGAAGAAAPSMLSTAIPTAVDTMTTGAIGGAGAATPALTAAAPATTGLNALQAAGTASRVAPAAALSPVAPTTALSGIETALPGLANPAGQSYAMGAGQAAAKVNPWAGLQEVTKPAAQASTGFFPPAPAAPGSGGLGGLLDKIPGGIMPWALGAQMLGGMFKGGGGGGKKEKEDDVEDFEYEGGEPVFPDESYEPGISDEWDYFPKKVRGYAQGGMVNGDPQAQMPQDMTFPQNGIGSLMSPEQIPESPYPSSQTGSEPEPDDIAVPTDNDKELIAQTVEAIQGKIPNPEQIMLAFVQTFGEQALQDLMARVQGMGQATGGGQADGIPALIDGATPAALSEGEYVVPADVVSGIGDGSTDAGAQQLDNMTGMIRKAKTGSGSQPPALGFSGGGLVSLIGR